MLQVRQKAVESSAELQDLLVGPAMLLRPVVRINKARTANKTTAHNDLAQRDQLASYV